MTKQELEKLALAFVQKSFETVTGYPKGSDAFIAGFLSGRDAAAEIAEKYEHRNNSAACGLVKEEIKKLGEN